MFRRKVPSGFWEAHYVRARQRLGRTSFRELLNYWDTHLNELIRAHQSYTEVPTENAIFEMKRNIAALQAIVDELNDDFKVKTR